MKMHKNENTIDSNDADNMADWIAVFQKAGEEGLLAFAKKHHNIDRGLGKTVERAFLRRLATVAGALPFSNDDFYKIASKLPEEFRPLIIDNPNCPETLIEDLWIGNYVDGMGNPAPTLVICKAFYNNHYKMISIYARRPDLRIYVSEYMREMVESSLQDSRDAQLNAC